MTYFAEMSIWYLAFDPYKWEQMNGLQKFCCRQWSLDTSSGTNTVYSNPKHDLFLTLTKCFLCLNLTRSQPQWCYNIQLKHSDSTHFWFAETYHANIYSGDWLPLLFCILFSGKGNWNWKAQNSSLLVLIRPAWFIRHRQQRWKECAEQFRKYCFIFITSGCLIRIGGPFVTVSTVPVFICVVPYDPWT